MRIFLPPRYESEAFGTQPCGGNFIAWREAGAASDTARPLREAQLPRNDGMSKPSLLAMHFYPPNTFGSVKNAARATSDYGWWREVHSQYPQFGHEGIVCLKASDGHR